MTFSQDQVVPDWDNSPLGKLKEPLPIAELAPERYRPRQKVNEFVPFEPEPVVISSESATKRVRTPINLMDFCDD